MKKAKQSPAPRPTAPPPSATGGRWKWWLPLLIAVITFVCLSPVLQNDFTNWDDPEYVLMNRLVKSDSSTIAEVFTTPVSANYHPLTILTLRWNTGAGKPEAQNYIRWNLVLHLANTLLAFAFIFLLTNGNLMMASIVSLFFGIHPMHVESVAWISERKDVLYVFFFLAGLITYLHYLHSAKKEWYRFTLLLFILSCLSKGMAVVFPVVLLLVDYYKGQETREKEHGTGSKGLGAGIWRDHLLPKIPFFVISLAFGVAAYLIQQKSQAVASELFAFFTNLSFAAYGGLMYVAKMFIPAKLSAFYPYPPVDELNRFPAYYYVFPFIGLGLLAGLWYRFRNNRAVVFGVLFYLVTIALVLQFIPVGNAIMADRYTYLSYIGLLFPLAYFADRTWQATSGWLASMKVPVLTFLLTGAVIFGYQTFQRTKVWKNSLTLWNDVLKKYPHAEIAWFLRGAYYEEQNDFEKAEENYSVIIRNNSETLTLYNVLALGNRAKIYEKRTDYPRALEDLNLAIKLNPQSAKLYVNRAFLYDKMMYPDRAIPDYRRYLDFKPEDHLIHNQLGLHYVDVNNFEEANQSFGRALELSPSVPNYWLNRSLTFHAMGNLPAAKEDALKAVQLGMKVDEGYLQAVGLGTNEIHE